MKIKCSHPDWCLPIVDSFSLCLLSFCIRARLMFWMASNENDWPGYKKKIMLQDHHQQRPSHRLCHCHINDQRLWIESNETVNATDTTVIETNWYANVSENGIVAIWVIIIQAFQHHDVHRASVNRHGLNGFDIRMVGDRVAQHLAQVPAKVWSHHKVVATNVHHGTHYRRFVKTVA